MIDDWWWAHDCDWLVYAAVLEEVLDEHVRDTVAHLAHVVRVHGAEQVHVDLLQTNVFFYNIFFIQNRFYVLKTTALVNFDFYFKEPNMNKMLVNKKTV